MSGKLQDTTDNLASVRGDELATLSTEPIATESNRPTNRNRRSIFLGIGIALLLLLIVTRTSRSEKELERVFVSGKASYQGEPIIVGQIRFSPIPPSKGPLTIEQIRDGKYNTSLNGGLPVGTHRVAITMFRPEEYATMGRSPGSPGPEQLLPEKFNRESELTIKVSPGGEPFEHNFVLTD
jgi:hypothetical protein